MGCNETATPDTAVERPVFLLAVDGISFESLVDEEARIDADRFPHLAFLAHQSTIWTTALAPSDQPLRTFEALVAAGLCPWLEGQNALWNDSPCGRQPERTEPADASSGSPIDDRAARFRRFIASIDADRSGYYVFRSSLPDAPWEYLANGERYRAPLHQIPGRFGEFWGWSTSLVEQGRQRHEQQLRFLDSLIGEFLARLDEQNLFDRSTIVLLATRGLSFRPGEKLHFLSEGNLDQVLRVPVLIHSPGQVAGAVVTTPLSLVDLPSWLDGTISARDTPIRTLWSSGLHHPAFPVLRPGAGALELPKLVPEPGASIALPADLTGAPPADVARDVAETAMPAGGQPLRLYEHAGVFLTDGLGSTLGRDEFPVLLTGRLRGVPGLAPALTLEINGRTVDRVDTYGPPGGEFWFSFFQSSHGHLEDRNEVAFYVQTDVGAPLRRLPVISDDADLDFGTDGEDSPACGVEGYAERIEWIGDEISLRGWARARNAPNETFEIEIEYEGRRLYTWTPDGDWSEMRRYELRLPAHLVPGRERFEFRSAIANERCGRTWLQPLYPRYAMALSSTKPPWITHWLFRQTLHLDEDRSLPVRFRREHLGWIDEVRQGPQGWIVQGWAGDLERGEAATMVYAIHDDVAVAAARVIGIRSDVATAMGQPGLERSGFEIVLPPGNTGYRILVVTRSGWAAELRDMKMPLP